jgi:hypothetical protein
MCNAGFFGACSVDPTVHEPAGGCHRCPSNGWKGAGNGEALSCHEATPCSEEEGYEGEAGRCTCSKGYLGTAIQDPATGALMGCSRGAPYMNASSTVPLDVQRPPLQGKSPRETTEGEKSRGYVEARMLTSCGAGQYPSGSSCLSCVAGNYCAPPTKRAYDTGGATGNYQDNEKGIMTELTCSSFPLTLNVVSYAVETGYDYLEMLDSTGKVLVKDPAAGYTYSSPSKVTLRFTSDSSTTRAGYEVSWYCNDPVTTMVQCPSGTFSAAGASSCLPCPAGSRCVNGIATLCSGGTFSGPNASTCSSCTGTNYSLAGASSCSTCLAGSYCLNGIIAPCTGTSFSAAGASSCSPCPAGSRCANGVATQCSAGTFAGPNSNSCNSCFGTTFSVAGASSCSPCPAGSRCVNGVATQCSAGTFSGPNANSCTSCPNGSYSLTGSLSCITGSCPIGWSCSSNGAAVLLDVEYWAQYPDAPWIGN